MIQKIKNSLLVLALVFSMAVPAVAVVSTGSASAACTKTAGAIADGANAAANSDGAITCEGGVSGSTTGIKNLAKTLVNILSVIVGIASVIMIIYGGFRYVVSGGDSGSVGNAKNTLVYAIVGLIIVALAQVIVKFVLGATDGVSL